MLSNPNLGASNFPVRLRPPGDLHDSRILPGLTGREPFTHRRAVAVVLHGLYQEPACVGRAGLGDLALKAFADGGVLRRHDAEEA